MNKTITIYELLGLVKDGKAPKKIQFDNHVYIFYMKDDYINANNDYDEHLIMDLFTRLSTNNALNTIVEIIEDNDKLEKIKSLNNVGSSINLTEFEDKQHLNNHILKDKINKIIDHINKIEEKLDER